ncbi:MAG: prepilin-type N-terminal cleavage/methylation domain-containing protein [Candidatus Omnitrophica bacterium]|nr:prepilin-type N-terminal cleavage/methylation domain-containing protein [Candidatus Omnitrophota bacterium]
MRRLQGFTLVEVMAAVLIFMIGLVGILFVSIESMSMTKRAEYAYTAYNLAKNRLETLRAMSFDDLASAEETEVTVDESGVSDEAGNFIRSTAIETGYSGDSDLVSAAVTVSYLFKGQQSGGPMEMSTVIYNAEG